VAMRSRPCSDEASTVGAPPDERRRYAVRGIVQGVGFRPFVFRLATSRSIRGFVRNDSRGVELEIEGRPEQLDGLIAELRTKAPPLAEITEVVLLAAERGPSRYADFGIAPSDRTGAPDVVATPDACVCDDCLRELFAPDDRRYRYPFINCTRCGPRFTIVREVPYDRDKTTMAPFTMCDDCAREYADPTDRRFHAQPNACGRCGPCARLLARDGSEIAAVDPVEQCARLLRDGAVIAVKGIGGYHVMCDAANEDALAALRRRKRRPHKPFALMSENLEELRKYAYASDAEAAILLSTARPIVILRRREPAAFPELVAPGCSEYGVMLAYAPIHHLLLHGRFTALVATSANVSDEPIVYRDGALAEELGEVVDGFLTHDREIHTRVDDSILRCVDRGCERQVAIVRRARGFTPKPIEVSRDLPCVLAVGGELKNTICVTRGRQLFLSQHVGDLTNVKNYEFFVELCERMPRVLGVRPELVACDLHPEFMNGHFARSLANVEVVAVQHHHAHLAACAGEHDLREPVLGVTFDGMGYGADGTAWGGEFLLASYAEFERVAHMRYFGLVGGDRAVHEPYRVACALVADALGVEALDDVDLPPLRRRTEAEKRVLRAMIARGIHTPRTSSVGRLFDGVAALIGVRDRATYEGQAAIELERLAGSVTDAAAFPYTVERDTSGWEVDVRPMVRALVEQLHAGAPREVLAARFHATIAAIVRDTCALIVRERGVRPVVLSGGVFLNRNLLVRCHRLLEEHGLRVLSHHWVPTNDGGLAFGQALVAAAVAGAR
jgi:hydrogenase maturation protein HypF